ncbi:MAG: hypothetical protein NDP13_01160 [Crenarchaeota archaeon]|nr:hypothetical protein [Thermoproteota archaeon]MCR8454775.1 hypothetical protein [Thermoproteota archaeon]
MMGSLSLKKIARIVKTENRKHDFIVALFQMYFEKSGVPRSNLIVMDNYNELQPDLVWVHNNFPVVVVEVMDPEVNIRDPTVRGRFEKLLVLPYIQILRPWYVVLTDGISMFIYNYEFKLVYQNDDLEGISSEEEHRIRKILFLE